MNFNQIEYFRLKTLRSAVKLETLGMKRRGTSAMKIVKTELGLKLSTKGVDVLAALDARIEEYAQGQVA